MQVLHFRTLIPYNLTAQAGGRVQREFERFLPFYPLRCEIRFQILSSKPFGCYSDTSNCSRTPTSEGYLAIIIRHRGLPILNLLGEFWRDTPWNLNGFQGDFGSDNGFILGIDNLNLPLLLGNSNLEMILQIRPRSIH
ncbi:MAG TPA: hypothetical protein DIW81_22920 [Planctomycetaceae bacterium]|nr:hypothetical protein [Planctomycetaceae bacterium]